MSDESIRLAGILLIVFPTVVFGGVSLLYHLVNRRHGYVDNPARQNLWRAGHAHAGVLLILALIALLLLEYAELPGGLTAFVRSAIPISAILLPVAFFLSVLSPNAERPNALINLAYVGAVLLSAALLTLGIGLLRT